MTPTEQDKELRIELARKVYSKPTPVEIMTWGTPEAVVEMYADSPIVYAFANFITADRKRVELEARIDELKKVDMLTKPLLSNSGSVETNVKAWVKDRLPQLKAHRRKYE